MHYAKKPDGWYRDGFGPFATMFEAQQFGLNEKKQGKLTFALDYHKTYSADPKFWNVFIQLVWLRKDKVYCVTHSTDPDELADLYDSIGKIIGKDCVIETKGEAKLPYCKRNNIDIDIWIDNNPIHIIESPPPTDN